MGFFDKIKQGLEKTRRQMGGLFAEFSGENEEFYDELEEPLIIADAGAATAEKAVGRLREKVRSESLRGQDEVRAALADKGVPLLVEGATNQIFPILPDAWLAALQRDFVFTYQCRVDETHSAVRICTSWATQPAHVQALKAALAAL